MTPPVPNSGPKPYPNPSVMLHARTGPRPSIRFPWLCHIISFRRSLSNGKGGVYINGNYCPVVGRVCMDMIMVEITNHNFEVGDAVEIIGQHQKMEDFAQKMDTIPYEVMTNFSKRVHRVYLTN